MRFRRKDKVRIDCWARVIVSQPSATVVSGNGNRGDGRTLRVELDEDYVIPAGSSFTLTPEDVYRAAAR